MTKLVALGRRALREPLAQFLVTGAVIFALERAAHRASPEEAPRRLVVDDAFVRSVMSQYVAATGKAVSAEERRALLDEAVDEEILYREARALRLDENDSIVRRRLVQKAEFLLEDARPIEPPTGAEIAAYYAAHAAAYARPEAVTFRHVFFSRDRRGEGAERDAQAALEALGRDPEARVTGDAFLAGDTFVARTERDVDALWGVGAGGGGAAPARRSLGGAHRVSVRASSCLY